MLDHVCIFAKSGAVLWSKNYCTLNGDPINGLIGSVMLEERQGGECRAVIDKYEMRWTLENELDLVFVVIYQSILHSRLLYIDHLLLRMKEEFLKLFRDRLPSCTVLPFDQKFEATLRHVEQSEAKSRRGPKKKIASTISKKKKKDDEEEGEETSGRDASSDEECDAAVVKTEEELVAEARARLRRRGKKKQDDVGASKRVEEAPKQPKGKAARVWHSSNGKVTKQKMKKLNHNQHGDEDDEDSALLEAKNTYLPSAGETADWERDERGDEEEEEESDDDSDEEEKGGESSGWSFGRSALGGFLKSITGNKTLEAEDIDPVMEHMRELLIRKNVAAEIAEEVCASVRASLIGQKLASFSRVKTAVREALETALVRILTPKRSTDILREIHDAKVANRTYTIVFVGVNGVGKSTSLSKVCYYLKHHGVSVMMAACDTFRSGAVEQLRTHARCLDVPLYSRGYGKDIAALARDAKTEAQNENFDCLVIDTAGRMQNNVQLMKDLSRLISVNTPDLVLFVGEALVGNDGIDQLSMFDQALQDYSPPGECRRIDGIVLTKFDTIDDKVGAALSMSYRSGQPIVFVGTGQKYTHLRKLNVKTVIRALFA